MKRLREIFFPQWALLANSFLLLHPRFWFPFPNANVRVYAFSKSHKTGIYLHSKPSDHCLSPEFKYQMENTWSLPKDPAYLIFSSRNASQWVQHVATISRQQEAWLRLSTLSLILWFHDHLELPVMSLGVPNTQNLALLLTALISRAAHSRSSCRCCFRPIQHPFHVEFGEEKLPIPRWILKALY